MIRLTLFAFALSALPVAALAAPVPAAPSAVAAPGEQAVTTISYGPNMLQKLDFHPANGTAVGPRPLIVFVHGGAWVSGDKLDSTGAAKLTHYPASGYHFATVNYRLLPEAEIDAQAQDVAAALAGLVERAGELGIDKRRIVLMGHGAGAHLVSLVGTDPAYLGRFALSPEMLAGVVSIDGAALDVPRQIADAGPLLGIGYRMAFGSDASRQNALSPAWHVNSANARRFLLLHVERRDSTIQADRFALKLKERNIPAEVAGFPGRGMEGHNQINSWLGLKAYAATATVDNWLEAAFADPDARLR